MRETLQDSITRLLRYQRAPETATRLLRTWKHNADILPKLQRRRVSTTLRQVLAKFNEFFICWVFHKEISRQDALGTTQARSVDPQHPRFCPSSSAFRFSKLDRCGFIWLLPQAAVPEWKPAC
jgi:hypothetical protein